MSKSRLSLEGKSLHEKLTKAVGSKDVKDTKYILEALQVISNAKEITSSFAVENELCDTIADHIAMAVEHGHNEVEKKLKEIEVENPEECRCSIF